MTTIFRRVTILAVLFTERFVLSFVFFCLAWSELNKIRNLLAGPAGRQTVFIGTAHHFVLLTVGLSISLLLLFGRTPAEPPQKLKLIFVPLFTTFFNLFYFSAQWLPAPLQMNLCPLALRMPFMIAGMVFIVLGPMISLWGLLSLGRSFGIFVTVRTVVLGGPYRWVRHPMYLGWVCSFIGIALANFTGAYLLIVTVHVLLMVYRARLEEAHLSENSPEYREYRKRTGFIFPRFRQAAY